MNQIEGTWTSLFRVLFVFALLVALIVAGALLSTGLTFGWDTNTTSKLILSVIVMLFLTMIWGILTAWETGLFRYIGDTIKEIRMMDLQIPRPAWLMAVARGCMFFSPFLIAAAFAGPEKAGYANEIAIGICSFLFVLGTCYWAAHTPEAERPKEKTNLAELPPPTSWAPGVHRSSSTYVPPMVPNSPAMPRKEKSQIWQEGYDKGYEAGVNKTIAELIEEEIE